MSRAKRQIQRERSRQAREERARAQRRQRRKTAAIRIGAAVGVLAVAIAITSLVTDDDNDAADAPTTTLAPTTTAPVTTTTLAVLSALPEGCVDTVPEQPAERAMSSAPPEMQIDPERSYTATIATSCGDIVVALDAANAPTSVNNFVSLARAGFYDGLQWPRASNGFVIQSGSPTNDQNGGPGYSIVGELPPDNTYAPGSVAWAKADAEPAGTAGSQFFVVTGDPGGLNADPVYGHIGTVTSGIENAQKIESLRPGDGDGPPVIPVYIFSVTITES